jgi:hypothetical protein
MSWRHLSLILAALAGAVFFLLLYGAGPWHALPAGLVAGLLGLEWVGIPLLSRLWRRGERR